MFMSHLLLPNKLLQNSQNNSNNLLSLMISVGQKFGSQVLVQGAPESFGDMSAGAVIT